MKRTGFLIALGAGIVLVSAGGLLAAGDAWKQEPPAKPTLRLKASTRNGFTPLKVTLTGDIAGGDQKGVNSCLLSEEWVGEKAPDLVVGTNNLLPNTKRTIPCVTALDDGNVPRSFRREVVLQESGTYTYRILYTAPEDRTIASQAIEIRVIRTEPRATLGVSKPH